MPTYTLELLSNPPILLFTVSTAYRVSNDLPSFMADAIQLLDVQKEPVYFISDLSKHHKIGFDELAEAAYDLAHMLYHHPNIRELLVVSKDEVMRMAYQGGDSEAYGYLHFQICATLDHALAYIRSK